MFIAKNPLGSIYQKVQKIQFTDIAPRTIERNKLNKIKIQFDNENTLVLRNDTSPQKINTTAMSPTKRVP